MLGEQNAPNGVEQFEGGQNPPENHCGKKVLGSCVQVKFYTDKRYTKSLLKATFKACHIVF